MKTATKTPRVSKKAATVVATDTPAPATVEVVEPTTVTVVAELQAEKVTILSAAERLAKKQAIADQLAADKAEAKISADKEDAERKVMRAEIAQRKAMALAGKAQSVRAAGAVVTEEEDVVAYAVDKLNAVSACAGSKKLYKFEKGSNQLIETKHHAEVRLSHKLENRKVFVALNGEEVGKAANVYQLYNLLQTVGVKGVKVSLPALSRMDGGAYLQTGLQCARLIARAVRKAFEVDASAVVVDLK